MKSLKKIFTYKIMRGPMVLMIALVITCTFTNIYAQNIKNIQELNLTINKEIGYKKELNGNDDWQLPEKTISLREGDCEDFAILKLQALYRNGYDMSKVKMSFIKIEWLGKIESHMVLIYDEYVLDNLYDEVKKVDERKDIEMRVADFSWSKEEGAKIFLHPGIKVSNIAPYMLKWEMTSKEIFKYQDSE